MVPEVESESLLRLPRFRGSKVADLGDILSCLEAVLAVEFDLGGVTWPYRDNVVVVVGKVDGLYFSIS